MFHLSIVKIRHVRVPDCYKIVIHDATLFNIIIIVTIYVEKDSTESNVTRQTLMALVY